MSFSRLFSTLLLIVALQTNNACSELVVCNEPSNFTVHVSESQSVTFYDSELIIIYEPAITVYTYPNSSAVNLLLNDSIITFSASKQHLPEFGRAPEKVSWIIKGRVLGVGELETPANDVYSVSKSELFLQANSSSSTSLPYAAQIKVVRFAQTCIVRHLCDKLKLVKADQLRNSTNSNKFGPLFATSKDVEEVLEEEEFEACEIHGGPREIDANNFVDGALQEFRRRLKHDGNYKTPLPNIKEKFHTGSGIFKTTGDFDATDGHFENITTIVRKGDAQLVRKGLKYYVTSAFEFKTAIVKYSEYMLRYGIFKFRGKVSADVTGLTTRLMIILDFSGRQCAAKVEEVEVTDVGKLKVNLTGFGLINKWISKLVTHFAKFWRVQASLIVKEAFSEVINSTLISFDCKTYGKASWIRT